MFKAKSPFIKIVTDKGVVKYLNVDAVVALEDVADNGAYGWKIELVNGGALFVDRKTGDTIIKARSWPWPSST